MVADERVPERRGFPMMSIGYFRFTAKVEPVVTAAYLVDIDQKTTLPIIAEVLPDDRYTTTNLVAVAPVPGIVIVPEMRQKPSYVVSPTSIRFSIVGW